MLLYTQKINLKYKVSGEKNNIVTKTGLDGYLCVICEDELENNKIYKWKIKIFKTRKYDIKIGIACINYMGKSQNYQNGWYLFTADYNLYSRPPQNFSGINSGLKKDNEIIVSMDINKGILKFITKNEDKGDCYTIIPKDKPLFPSIIFYSKDDFVEIINC